MDSTSRLAAKKSAKVLPEILNYTNTLSSISTLRKVFESCLGPYGHCKLVHNNKGGHVTVTSSASRLLQSAQISAPVLRLISSAVEEHCKNYADCGKFTATLMLLLIEKALTEQLHVCELLELLAHECAEFVSSDCSSHVRKVVSFDTLDDLVCLVRGVVSPKSVCVMSSKEVNHVCQCIVKAFLFSFPNSSIHGEIEAVDIEHINVLRVLGRPVLDSYIVQGILVQTCYVDDKWLAMNNCSIAVFKCSMAGDSTDSVISTNQLEIDSMLDIDQIMIDRMMETVNTLITEHSVGIIVCQKVLHPRVKRYLRNRNILVLDRVGLSTAEKLARVSGAAMIGSMLSSVNGRQLSHMKQVGRVDSVDKMSIGNNQYLCFKTESRPVCTFVLGSPADESACELEDACNSAYSLLKKAIHKRQALVGGGTWQRHLAVFLRQHVSKRSTELASRLECENRDVLLGIECVAYCLDRIATVISGVTTNNDDSSVLDLASHCVSAMYTAINVAQMVLNIGHYVLDCG